LPASAAVILIGPAQPLEEPDVHVIGQRANSRGIVRVPRGRSIKGEPKWQQMAAVILLLSLREAHYFDFQLGTLVFR